MSELEEALTSLILGARATVSVPEREMKRRVRRCVKALHESVRMEVLQAKHYDGECP